MLDRLARNGESRVLSVFPIDRKKYKRKNGITPKCDTVFDASMDAASNGPKGWAGGGSNNALWESKM